LVAAKLALYEEEAQLKQRLGPCSFFAFAAAVAMNDDGVDLPLCR